MSSVPSGVVSFFVFLRAEMHHWFLCALLRSKRVFSCFLFNQLFGQCQNKNNYNFFFSEKYECINNHEHIASLVFSHEKKTSSLNGKRNVKDATWIRITEVSTASDSINSCVREEELLLLLISQFVPSPSSNESSHYFSSAAGSSAKKIKQTSHLFLTFRKKKTKMYFIFDTIKLWG